MFKLNIFTGNLDEVGASSASPFFGPPVDTEADLPVPGTDGEIRIVKASRDVYQFSLVANNWKNVTKEYLDVVGSSPNANGLSQTTTINVDGVVEKHFNLQPADSTHPGVITAGTQSIGGTKTFDNTVKLANGVDSSTVGGTIGIGFVDAATINIGHTGATVNIQGTTNVIDVTNLEVTDKNITVNKNGPATSASGAGIEVEENASITGYAVVSPARTAWNLKAPATAGIASIVPGASGITLDQSSHNPLSLVGTGLGLSLDTATQVLTAQSATTAQPGLLSDTDWNTFNNKANSDLGNLTTTAINQNLLTDGTQRDIGTSSSHWGTVYSEFVRAYNHLRADSFLNIAGTRGFLFSGAALVPNGTLDLGSTSSRYANIVAAAADISGNINMNNTGEITNVVDPTAAQSAATKNYVDNHVVSLTTGVSGVLPIANGGTNSSAALTAGSVLFSDGTSVTQDNANLFWDDSSNRLGVGTATPLTKAHFLDSTSSTVRGLMYENIDSGVNTTANLILRKARGTIGSPSAIQSGDVFAAIGFSAFGTTTYPSAAGVAIIASASETQTDTVKGSALYFATTPIGSGTRRNAVSINANGSLSIFATTSGTISLAAAATTTSHTITLPAAQGAANTHLLNDGSGNLFWGTGVPAGDIPLTTFDAANNQAAPVDITGFAFNAATVRSFEALVSATLDATSPAYEAFKLYGINKGGSFDLQVSSIGDAAGVTFSITNTGQVQYISSNAAGFVTLKLAFRAITTQV